MLKPKWLATSFNNDYRVFIKLREEKYGESVAEFPMTRWQAIQIGLELIYGALATTIWTAKTKLEKRG